MPSGPHMLWTQTFSLLIACLVLPIGLVVAQCPNPASLDQYAAPCGSGLNNGQSFTAETTGFLDTVVIARCSGTDTRLILRTYVGTGSDWNTGNIIGEADQIIPGNGSTSDCFTSGGNGFANYVPDTFTFTSVAVQAGVQYILELAEGVAATVCGNNYSGGIAFVSTGGKSGEDLAFALSVCPDTPVFGCINPSACNYDSSASAEDGSCLMNDCAGQCGGTAYDDPDCGCVPSINDAGNCFGCTDAGACNFDPSATVDDGSCYQAICNGSCPSILDYYEEPCGTGLNYGQSFTASITGFLNSITISRCTGLDTRILVRKYNGDGADWDEGELIGEADQIVPGSGSPSDCFVSSNGFSNYVETTFTFTNMGMEQGVEYVFQLNQGVAATSCNLSYSGGSAFAYNGAKPSEDLAFKLSICPNTLTFGCTNPDACNYDANAQVEDGSCLQLDCQNVCGGNAYLDPDCGCLDSIDEQGSCLGCMDQNACNYDATATTADNSLCLFPDCNGDCGGTAISSPCGCIGGATGIPTSSCIGGCQTEVEATDATASSPGILYGQSITPLQGGGLKRVRLKTCCALNAQIVIREEANSDPCAPGGIQPWNSGTILGYSNIVASSCSGLGACVTGLGFDGYNWQDFNFNDLPVQAGKTYIIELVSGVAVANCASDYVGGMAFNATQGLNEYDLVFSLHICAESLVWGCNDSNACNFDPAATNDDGSCLYLDCNGDCGGTATNESGCGCIGGNTGIRESQCVNGSLQEIIANDGTICNAQLSGQTIYINEDGFLQRFGVHVMPDQGQTLRLTRADGPNAGEVIFNSSRSAESTACQSVDADWRQLNFSGIALQGGSNYQLDFISGNGSRTCATNYTDGNGIVASGVPSEHDLAFRLVYRQPSSGELLWGCTDPSYCNYDPSVTHDDGSCTVLDCNGDCGGSAYVITDCGCVEGNTGITAASCYGCTDPSKCNYDADVSIEDGSCQVYDCNGDCGGTAVPNALCGCVGGNSGIDPALCLEKCQSDPQESTYDGIFNTSEFATSGAGQTFTANSNSYLTAVRFRQFNNPSNALVFELRAMDTDNVHTGTLLASENHDSWTDAAGEGGNLFIEWDLPALLQSGQEYALIVNGGQTFLQRGTSNVYTEGASFDGSSATAGQNDLFFELFTCDDLLGCTAPLACNYDSWATLNDGSCTVANLGFDCDGNPCLDDNDGDGICSANDTDDNDPFVCTDSDNDGCDDCSTGTFDPNNDGNDIDGDGLCDDADLCTDVAADNYNDPDNEVCRGTCDTAPLFEGVVLSNASHPDSLDGTISLQLSEGNLPFIPPSDFYPTQLVLTGLNMTPDLTISLPPNQDIVIPQGAYSATVYDAEGCPGVLAAPGGTTFGQPQVSYTFILGYELCCGSCGISDIDTDGICDDVDNCTDRLAPNYDDPSNVPCE